MNSNLWQHLNRTPFFNFQKNHYFLAVFTSKLVGSGSKFRVHLKVLKTWSNYVYYKLTFVNE